MTDVAQVLGSDVDEDDVPLVTLVNKATSNVVTVIPPVVAPPRGDACIGLHIARDFGGEHGVCKGTIVSVDLNRRRPLYHVLYDDGDEEDYDDQELSYAIELHEAHKNGLQLTTQKIVEQRTSPTMHFFILTNVIAMCPPLGSDIDEDITSTHGSGDESEVDFCEAPQPQKNGKRKLKDAVSGTNNIDAPLKKRAKIGGKKSRQKDSGNNVGGSKTFTVEGVLSAFPEKTEYGVSFRAMCEDDQKPEVIRLNKGATSGMKGAIKKMRIDVQYKDLVSEKMKAFIVSSRTEQSSMFRAIPQTRLIQSMQIKFLSVGEWVEVQGDISPG